MRSVFQALATYSAGERKGMIFAIALVLLSFLIYPLGRFFYKESPADFSLLAAKIDSIESLKRHSYLVHDSLFMFDPNTLDSLGFMALGFTPRQIQTLSNYRRKGGRFYKTEGLQKIYGLPKELVERVSPYVKIDPPKKTNTRPKPKEKQPPSAQKILATELFAFDPNTVTAEEMKNLGFKPKLIRTIKNYRSKNGRFRVKEDFQKIYGVTEDFYHKMAPYIEIPPPKPKEQKKIVLIDLNTASEKDFLEIYIDKRMASKIIKYRDLLGGYYSMKQLEEVYGMNEYTLSNLLKKSEIKTPVQKLNINKKELKELVKHPYISYEIANDLTRYRKRKGAYTDLETLKIKKILTEKDWEKLLPYLSL